MNQKGFIPFKVAVLTLIIVITAIGGLYLIREFKNNTRKDYGEGEIFVTFDDEVTYGQAKEYIESVGLTIDGSNNYWKASGFIPNNSTVLNKIDIFIVRVPVGKEDEIVNMLNKKDIVHGAGKNSFGKLF